MYFSNRKKKLELRAEALEIVKGLNQQKNEAFDYWIGAKRKHSLAKEKDTHERSKLAYKRYVLIESKCDIFQKSLIKGNLGITEYMIQKVIISSL